MPTCSKCTDADLGRICPHQGPGRLVYEQGYDQGRADEYARWTLDGSTHYEGCETYHPRCEARMLRVIVTDLIAELQDVSTGYDPGCQNGCGDVPGAGCPTHYEQAVERAADRAEVRLREVSDE